MSILNIMIYVKITDNVTICFFRFHSTINLIKRL